MNLPIFDQSPMSLPMNRLKILVVEDELIVARDICGQLVQMGYESAGHATRGEEAVALAGQLRPDLVLMDIQLAGAMDGIAAAQTIRTQFGLPVVFLTAFDADDILERAKLTEPYGYILKPFSERELRTVLQMAIYKHQAEAKLVTGMRQLKALSQRVLEAQETERRRVAIELHDELGQSLTAIKINLQLSERIQDQPRSKLNADSIRIVEDALQQVRTLATGLRPSMLDDLGLAPALNWIAEQSAQRAGFAVRCHHERGLSRLAPEIETACFRIVQEALTNITRHARATQVTVHLRRDGDTLMLEVQDDGCGFDLAAMRSRASAGGSLGQLGMQERATLIGGQIELLSAPGRGTTVRLNCPWRSHEENL
jgi:signal transduction histidine kinase